VNANSRLFSWSAENSTLKTYFSIAQFIVIYATTKGGIT